MKDKTSNNKQVQIPSRTSTRVTKNKNKIDYVESKSKSNQSDFSSDDESVQVSKVKKSIKKQIKQNASPNKQKTNKKLVKGVWNPDFKHQNKICQQIDSQSKKPLEFISVTCSNKEFIRAAKHGNTDLLKYIFDTPKLVSTYEQQWGPDHKVTALDYLLKNKNLENLELYAKAQEEIKLKSQDHFAIQPQCYLAKKNTGYNNSNAYGTQVRAVELSRGGRQGNNAFMDDQQDNTHSFYNKKGIENSFTKFQVDQQYYENLALIPGFQALNNCYHKITQISRSGNRSLATYFAKYLQTTNQMNFLHHEVLKANDIKELSEFKPINVTKKMPGNNITPIHLACINPNQQILQALLDSKQELSIADDQQRKPIHYAAVCEGPEPLKLLMNIGVDIKDKDLKKNTPFMIACKYGRLDNVKLLIESQNDCGYAQKNKRNNCGIHKAAKNGHLNILQYLHSQDQKMDINGRNQQKALHIAAAQGHYECVEFLVETAKQKTNTKDKFKRSPLIMAVRNGHSLIASYLIQHGAMYEEPDSSKNYPIHFASAYGFPECIDVLVQANSNINATNSWNLTPICVALLKNHTGIVNKLLQYPKININCKNDQGQTIVSLAILQLSEENFGQIEYLVKEKKADLNIPDLQGWTPLHHAVSLNDNSYIRAQKDWKNTLQQQFELEKYQQLRLKLIKLLTFNNADLNALTVQNHSALYIALSKKNCQVVDYLLQQEQFDFLMVSKNDTCIYHSLNRALFSLKGHSIINYIIDKVQNQNNLLNLVDKDGFTPLLRFARDFSEKNKQMYENYINSEKKKTAFFDKNVSEKNAFQYFQSLQVSLVNIIQKMINFGANIRQNVIKIRKFRSDSMQIESDFSEQDCYLQNYGLQNILHLFLRQPSYEIIKYIVDLVDVNQVDLTDRTPLRLFIQENSQQGRLNQYFPSHYDVLDLLLQKGANPNIKDIKGTDAILASVISRKLKFTEQMAKHGANLNVQNSYGQIPLCEIVRTRKIQSVELLLKLGADPNYQDQFGRSALHYSVNSSNSQSDVSSDLELLLLRNGSQINQLDTYGRSPIFYGFINFSCKRSFKNNNNIGGGFGIGGYGFAGQYGQHQIAKPNTQTNNIDPIEIVSSLIAYQNCDVTIQDIYQRNLMHYAAMRNSHICGLYLLGQNVNINLKDNQQNTPVAISFKFKNQNFASMLIQSQANINDIVSLKKTDLNSTKNLDEYWNHKVEQKLDQFEKFTSVDSIEEKIESNDNSQLENFIQNIKKCQTIEQKVQANQPNQFKSMGLNLGEGFKSGGFNLGSQNLTQPQQLDNHSDDQDDSQQDENLEISNPDEDVDYNNNDQNDEFDEYDNKSEALSIIQDEKQETKITQGISYQKNNQKEDDKIKESDEQLYHTLFRLSVIWGWQGIGYLLIQNGFNISKAMQDSLSESKYNLLITLLSKVQNKQQITVINEDGQNLFHFLCKTYIQGTQVSQLVIQKIIKEFQVYDIDPSLKDKFQRSPLYYSQMQQFDFMTQKLLEFGLNANDSDIEGQNPFGLLVKQQNLNQNLKMQAIYLYYNYNINNQFKTQVFQHDVSINAFCYLIANEQINKQLFDIYIEKGLDVNQKEQNGLTALLYAIKVNSIDMVKYLLDKQQLNLQEQIDYQNKNPIHYVVAPLEFGSYENQEMLELLAPKFDLNHVDKLNNKPIIYAMQQDSGVMTQKLLELGAQKSGMGLIKRMVTSIVGNIQTQFEDLDFASDAQSYVQLQTKDAIIEEVIVPVDHLAQTEGQVKVLQSYNVTLRKCKLNNGVHQEYVFYVMQILHELNRNVYIVFTRWGRIGTDGQYQQTPFQNEQDAIKEFSKIFKEKTANEYDNDNFQKKSGKYQLVKMVYKNKQPEYLKEFDLQNQNLPASELENETQQLLQNITTLKIFSKHKKQLDTDSIPFSNLQKEQLEQAKQILNDLESLIIEIDQQRQQYYRSASKIQVAQKIQEISDKIMEKSGAYFEIIPKEHCKNQQVTPLSDINQLKEAYRNIESLLQLEITSKIILAAHYNSMTINPLDYTYKSLQVKLCPLQQYHNEYQLVKRYMEDGGGTQINLNNIFAIERSGEAEAFSQHKEFKNKYLLWHGTKSENIFGILQRGLQIAPIDAQFQGALLGKGVYFADQFIKSYGYCKTQNYFGGYSYNQDKNDEKYEYMLLCEVACGQIYIPPHNTLVSHPPSSYQCVKLQGKSGPSYKQNIVLANGAQVPLGKCITNNLVDNFLQHNEYVIYDQSQIRMRYLLQFKK